jgi:predicted naringenin-chalcone synthase
MSSDSIHAINSTTSSTAHSSYFIGSIFVGVSAFARFEDFGDGFSVPSLMVAEAVCSVNWVDEPRRLLGDKVAEGFEAAGLVCNGAAAVVVSGVLAKGFVRGEVGGSRVFGGGF